MGNKLGCVNGIQGGSFKVLKNKFDYFSTFTMNFQRNKISTFETHICDIPSLYPEINKDNLFYTK